MISRILLGLLTFFAVSVSGWGESLTPTAEPYYDDTNRGGALTNADLPKLMAQADTYKEARDKVEAWQRKESKLSQAEVIGLVETEVRFAVRSWVKAACACYLGQLKIQAKDLVGAKTAYQDAVYFAGQAVDDADENSFYMDDAHKAVSEDEGTKYGQMAQDALKKF